ncbi:hypothetical protein BJ508DRAFT_95669 [Ascobolus immersus RN42]|uniref:F-box domain-containing protein n=1 Tax=Ascobolus immersus RN42 TaxID=1160509 RepID=A0A3N4IQQ0_ASCIM|nr:hypothetical protein BJ508DRAFT_95669 [Ascobolus immersus RN42]
MGGWAPNSQPPLITMNEWTSATAFYSVAPTPTETATRTLLNLPIELRLEIYTHCSAFALLQLTQTCKQVYEEINARHSIYENAYGYKLALWICRDPLNIRRIKGLRGHEEKALFEKLYAPTKEMEVYPMVCRDCLELFEGVMGEGCGDPECKFCNDRCWNCVEGDSILALEGLHL